MNPLTTALLRVLRELDEHLTALAAVPAGPPESAAYWQGFNADGGPNPFPADTTDHADWQRGRRDNIPF
jgi:hypothetical protein